MLRLKERRIKKFHINNILFLQVVRIYYPYTRINATFWGKHQSINLKSIDFSKPDLFEKLSDLQGFPLKVTIFRRYPTSLKAFELPKVFHDSYLMKETWRSDGYSGVDGIMLSNAAISMNFTAVNIQQIGIDFGYKIPNGSFVGKE